MKLSIIIGLLLAIASLIFAFQNNDEIVVTFFDYSVTGSVALLIITSIIIGFIISMMIFVPGTLAAKWKIRKLQQEKQKLEKELTVDDIQYESEGLGSEGEGHINL